MLLAFGARLLVSVLGWALLVGIVVWSLRKGREPSRHSARRPLRRPRGARRLVERRARATAFATDHAGGIPRNADWRELSPRRRTARGSAM
jgi:membrane protein implicated in regulation of membrane protease activity